MTVKVLLLMILIGSIAAASFFGARTTAKPNET